MCRGRWPRREAQEGPGAISRGALRAARTRPRLPRPSPRCCQSPSPERHGKVPSHFEWYWANARTRSLRPAAYGLQPAMRHCEFRRDTRSNLTVCSRCATDSTVTSPLLRRGRVRSMRWIRASVSPSAHDGSEPQQFTKLRKRHCMAAVAKGECAFDKNRPRDKKWRFWLRVLDKERHSRLGRTDEGRGLVQHKHAGLLQQRPGQRQQLPLAHRPVGATLGHLEPQQPSSAAAATSVAATAGNPEAASKVTSVIGAAGGGLKRLLGNKNQRKASNLYFAALKTLSSRRRLTHTQRGRYSPFRQ